MADLSVTAANVLASSTATVRRRYAFGGTVTAGQAVYRNASDQWVAVDSNAAATGNALTDECGIALHGGAAGQPAAVCVEDQDFTPGTTLTNGSAVYSSVNAGGITHDVPASGAYPRFLGIAKSTTKMHLRPCASGAQI